MNSDFGIKLDPTPREQANRFNEIFELSKFEDIWFNFGMFNYNFDLEFHKIDERTLILGNMFMRGRGSFWFGKLVANDSNGSNEPNGPNDPNGSNGSNGPKDSDKMPDYGSDIISTITAETREEILKEISKLLPEIAASVGKV